MSRFSATTIDLSQLPAPDVIDALSYASIRQALIADFLARYPAYDLNLLEVDPAVKILEVAAYRELILRALINDKARALLLASAQRGDLDQLGVYYGVNRQTVRGDGHDCGRSRSRHRSARPHPAGAGSLLCGGTEGRL